MGASQPFGLSIKSNLIDSDRLPVFPVSENGVLVLANQLRFIRSEIWPKLPPIEVHRPRFSQFQCHAIYMGSGSNDRP